MRNVTGKSHGFHEIRQNSQFCVCSFRVCIRKRVEGIAVDRIADARPTSLRNGTSTKRPLEKRRTNIPSGESSSPWRFRANQFCQHPTAVCHTSRFVLIGGIVRLFRPVVRLYFIKSITIDGRGIGRQESRFTSVSGALCESADGQSDRRPVKRRFSPYPATGFPREDTAVCVDTRGPTCVIQ